MNGLNYKLVENLKKFKIPMSKLGTTIFVLQCLDANRIAELDNLDNENKEKSMLALYTELELKGLIESVDEGEVHYRITQEGQEALDYISVEANIDIRESTPQEIVNLLPKTHESVAEWILEYINIFPEGKVYDKKLRTSSAECTPRMEKFIQKYKFSKEIILEATRNYLKDERNGQIHTRNSSYFIYKHTDNGYISDLLTYCENIQNKNNAEVKYNEDVI